MIELIVIVSAVVQVVFLVMTIVRLSKVNKTLEQHRRLIQGVSTLAESARRETDNLSHELALIERQVDRMEFTIGDRTEQVRLLVDGLLQRQRDEAPEIGWHRRQAIAEMRGETPKYPAAQRHYDHHQDNYHPREEGE
jgi:hypothetical protein